MDFPGEEVGVGERELCVCVLHEQGFGSPSSLREFPLAFAGLGKEGEPLELPSWVLPGRNPALPP